MNYTLIVLTHGDSAPLRETLRVFGERVSPFPAEVWMHRDGPVGAVALDWPNGWPVGHVETAARPLGFCGATRRAWEYAAASEHPHVFWLEHDFLIERPVDLRDLAAVLDANPQLAQMQLMRTPVNRQEKAAGGLFESRPGEYERRWWSPPPDVLDRDSSRLALEWQHHRSYLTTNPSLMRRDFMADNPWPDYPATCEGLFGIDLVNRGYSYGVWGSGEPWVKHVGVRTGKGY